MNILIVAATKTEIITFVEHFKLKQVHTNWYFSPIGSHSVDCLVSGVGMVSVTFELALALSQKKYDFVLNVGIAGTYDNDLPIGSLVEVREEIFGDLGVDDNGTFKTIFDEKITDLDKFPYIKGKLQNNSMLALFTNYKQVIGLSVNTVSGSKTLINNRLQIFKPNVETMEGAAVFYVCLKMGVDFAELRAISNIVEPRNRANWNIPLAINNLNSALIGIFDNM